jgi:hypothetical protein
MTVAPVRWLGLIVEGLGALSDQLVAQQALAIYGGRVILMHPCIFH